MAQHGLAAAVVADHWVFLKDAAEEPAAVGAWHRGRFLMNEELFPAAALKLYAPATANTALALPPAVLSALEEQAGEAGLLFVSGARLDHAAMAAGGFVRWFTHAGQAFLRRDQLASAMVEKITAEPPLAQLSATPPSPETLDGLYNNYCTLTGQWPRYRRPLSWWQTLLTRTDLTVRGIELPTYDEEDPESLTGPRDISGYVVYRDVDDRREFLETVVSVIDGDEDENIDLLLNDALHTLVRGAFGLSGTTPGGKTDGPQSAVNELVGTGRPATYCGRAVRCTAAKCASKRRRTT